MSDIFEQTQERLNRFVASQEAVEEAAASRQSYWQGVNARQSERSALREANIGKYKVYLADEDYAILNNAIANAAIPEDEAYRMAAAIELAKQYDMPLHQARANLSQYVAGLFGTDEKYHIPKTAFNAVWSAGRNGVNTVKYAKLGNELNSAVEAGDEERINLIARELDVIEKENEEFADYQPRNFVVEALKFGAQSAPFTGYVAGAGIIGGLFNPFAGTAASMAASMDLARGSEYLDLRKAGVNHEIARDVSLVSGVIQGAIETGLGNVVSIAGGALKQAGKGLLTESPTRVLIGKLASDVFKKLHYGGTFRHAAGRIAMEYLGETLEEGLEEVLQELTSVTARQVAASLQGEGVETATAREAAAQIAEAFRGGAMGSLALGIPGTFLNARASARSALAVKTMAETTDSQEAFLKETAAAEIFEGMGEEKRKAAQEAIYAKAAMARDKSIEKELAEVKETMDLGEGAAERESAPDEEGNIVRKKEFRTQTGSLYIDHKQEERPGGVVSGIFKAGNALEETSHNRYGHISYEQNGDRVAISEFQMAPGWEYLREELYRDFAQYFSGYDIAWDPQTDAGIEIKERLESQNPRGENTGLSYYADPATAADDRVRSEIISRTLEHTSRTNAVELSAVLDLFESMIKPKGLGLAEAWDDWFGGEKITGKINHAVEAAQKQGTVVKGAASFAHAAGQAKALIYVSRNADASTLLHEFSHVAEAHFTPEERRIAARALNGVTLERNGSRIAVAFDENAERWTNDQREAFADNLETYLATGVAPEAIKPLFEKIKEFMRRIYRTIRDAIPLSSEAKQFYESLIAGDLARQAEEKTKLHGASQTGYDPRTPEGASNNTVTEFDEHGKGEENDEKIALGNPYAEQINAQIKRLNFESTEAARKIAEERHPDMTASSGQQENEKIVLGSPNTERIKAILENPQATHFVKTEAAFDLAGDLFQAARAAQGQSPEELAEAGRQYDEIVNRYTNPDGSHAEGWLQVPNGKSTNLTENQWVQVRTPAFKAWFGDWENDPENASKVLDENGEPLVVYHGTNAEFNIFDSEKQGTKSGGLNPAQGFFFTPDPARAVLYGDTVKAFFLNAKADRRKAREQGVTRDYIKQGEDFIVFSPEQIKSATDNAGTFSNNNPSILFQIIGERGAETLDQAEEATTRLDNLDVARQMETAGKDAKAIRLATGWERGADGLWRYEIADDFHFDLSRLNTIGNFSGWLEDILSHDELFSAYPQLRQTTVIINSQEALKQFFGVPYAGAYSAKKNEFHINYRTLERGGIESLDSIFTHEIQHAIQNIEGFSYGSSNSHFDSLFTDTEDITEFMELDEEYRQYKGKKKLAEWLAMPENFKRIQSPLIKDIVNQFKDGKLGRSEAFEKLWELHRQHYDNLEKKQDAYNRTAGEVEARNAQTRMGFASQQRLETLLADTEDVSREDQIFLANGAQLGTAMAMMEAEGRKTRENIQAVHAAIAEIADGAEETTAKEIRPDLAKYGGNGNVTFIWGDEKKGLYHIGYRRGPEVVANVIKTVLTGAISRYADAKKTVTLADNGYEAVLSLDRNGENQTWLLTGWKENEPDATGEVSTQSGATQNGPAFSRSDLGAGTLQILDDLAGEVKDNSEAYDASLFQTQEELEAEAMSFDNWPEFMEYEETMRTEDSRIPENADAQWFQTFWETVHGIRSEESAINSDLYDRWERDDNSPSDPKTMDALWMATEMTKAGMTKFSERIGIIARTDLEHWQPMNEEDAADRDRTATLQDRIKRELRHGSWLSNAVRVLNGAELTERQYRTLRTLVSNSVRDYRSLYAEIMDAPEYAVALADTTAAELNTRIADPDKTAVDLMSPEQRRRLAEDLDIEDVSRELENGTLKVDERLEKAWRRIKEDQKALAQKIQDLQQETEEDYRRISDYQTRQLLQLAEEMYAAKFKWKNRSDKTARMIERGLKITKKYENESQQMKANYNALFRKFSDLKKAAEVTGFVREALARREAQFDERVKNDRLNRQAHALAEIKRMRTQLVKRFNRRVRFDRIDYKNAVLIIAIQRMMHPSMIRGVNRWLGTEGPLLRAVYSQYTTDSDFKAKLLDSVAKRSKRAAGKLDRLLGKSYDKMTKTDRQELYKLLPKQDWVMDLGLLELEKERREAIQLDITENKNDKGEVVSVTLGEELERMMDEALPYDLYARIQNRPFADWTLEEMEQLAKVVDDLYTQGRREYRARQEARKLRDEGYRDLIAKTITDAGIEIGPGDSPEEKKKKLAKIDRILGKFAPGVPGTRQNSRSRQGRLKRILAGYGDANIRRVARILDNDKDGINTTLLYWLEDKAFNQKQQALRRRWARVEESRKKLGIALGDLTKKIVFEDFFKPGQTQEFTVEELLHVLLSENEEQNKAAVMYGNFWLPEEKDLYRDKGISDEELFKMSNTAQGRYNRVIGEANKYFSAEGNEKFLKFAEAIERDYADNGERMNRFTIEEFNMPMWRVDYYLPMNRLDSAGETNPNRVLEDLAGISAATNRNYVNKGTAKKRIDIPPEWQTPIALGLYSTWVDSVERTEHLMAYGGLVRTLNSVYKSRDGDAIRQEIQDRYGDGMTGYINEYINELANPWASGQMTALDRMARALRGKTATAYLAWKTSGIIKQAITSPAPFFQYMNPKEYAAAAIDMAAHPTELSEAIRSKSMHMATRVFDPMLDLIREQHEKTENKVGHALNKFNELGMKGLELIDWMCVAPGWLAVYRRELARLQNENQAKYEKLLEQYRAEGTLATEEARAAKAENKILGEDEIEEKAVALADDIVRLVQPSGRLTDLAPMFKSRGPNSEIARIFLQFQTSLNVIWQNIRYDMPWAIRQKKWMQLVGGVSTYAIAGIVLGLVTEGLGGEDDKKKKKGKEVSWQQRVGFYATTQFTDSIPIIGSQVTAWTRKLITGKGSYMPTNLFPVEKEFFDTITAAADALQKQSDGQKKEAQAAWRRSAGNFVDLLGYVFGAPVSGVKEGARTLGIGDDDEKPGINPGALLGRR